MIVAPVGIWDKDDTLPLVRHGNSSQSTVVSERAGGGIQGEAITLTTIDRLVAQHGLSRVDLIKMDIEGAEIPAIRGAAETIRRFKPRLSLAAYHTPEDLAGVPAAVRAIRDDYVLTPARCLPVSGGNVIPNLYFE